MICAVKRTRYQGVYARHRTRCPAESGGRCSCRPGFVGKVYDRGTRKARWGPVMGSAEQAAAWRRDTLDSMTRRGLPDLVTVREAADSFLAAAKAGEARNRYGRPYKPEAIRDYEGMFDRHLGPLDGLDLASVTRADVQKIVDGLLRDGKSASTCGSAVTALRALWRWALARDMVPDDRAFSGVRMPEDDSVPRESIPTVAMLERLLAALPELDQLPYALAGYATGRRQEIRALKWADVDLKAKTIRWGEDATARKSPAAKRRVPIVKPLRLLLERAAKDSALVVPGARGGKFSAEALAVRSATRWENAGLEAVGLHDCRHAAASYMIAAGANIKALSVLMGHASIAITVDLYGHLFPGAEDEVGRALDRYLAKQSGRKSGRNVRKGL